MAKYVQSGAAGTVKVSPVRFPRAQGKKSAVRGVAEPSYSLPTPRTAV